ncbi:MAG: tetratricopeptide repeat protein, partial [Candidatus Omnitrophota bacterium]
MSKTSLAQKTALIFLGLILTTVILEAGLRLGGFVLTSIQEHRNRISISRRGVYRILCLGESTTAGEYPRFLEESLNQRDIGIKFSVIDKGVPGIRTSAIVALLEANLATYHPDMVITMMGINDYGPHLPYEPLSDSKVINFFKSYRTYKLIQLLGLHIRTRLEAIYRSEQSFPKNALQPMRNKETRMPEEAPHLEHSKAIEEGNFYRSKDEFSKAEEQYKKAIKLNPQDDKAHIELGNSYRERGGFSLAEQQYREALKLNPRNDRAYVERGTLYRKQNKLTESEEQYKEALKLNPGSDGIYCELGKTYNKLGKATEEERAHKKALELNPKNYNSRVRLGDIYREQKKFSDAEQLYKQAIEIDPKNNSAYRELGECCRRQKKFAQAGAAYKKVLELDSQEGLVYAGLVESYMRQNKASEAIGLFEASIEANPQGDRTLGALEILYNELGNSKLATKYGVKAKELRQSRYILQTAQNYQKLREVLKKKNITYVCAQYPMRELD